MTSLNDIRAAQAIAHNSVASNLAALRTALRHAGLHSAAEILASLDGDIHELDLLRRRELSVIESGRDLETTEHREP